MRKPNEKTAKLGDVAREAGVSQGTVSNVFNRPQIVREEVRQHVRDVAKRLGYSGPDPKGRLLRAGKVNAIGIATTDSLSYFFEDPFARAVMSGITEAAGEAGAGVSLISAANEEALGWNVRSALVDGFILFCLEDGERLVALTKDRQLPFVALSVEPVDPSISTVVVDNRAGARLAADHLTSLGHRDVAIIGMGGGHGVPCGRVDADDMQLSIDPVTRDRVNGYLEGLAEAGIESSAVPVFRTDNERATVTAALEELFADRAPTALLLQSDKSALIAIEWLQSRGLRVPEDVSVVGFDGVAEGESSTPKLTTIGQPMAEMGKVAVSIILDGKANARQVLPVELIVRESTAPPRSS